MNRPFFSVIINCHNGESFLKEAIDSVYFQTFENWEIIFWNNASSDNSSKIAHNYDDRIQYYSSTEKHPLYVARNLAIQKASGDYLAFIDADDIWEKNKLRNIKELIEKKPFNSVYASNFRYILNGNYSSNQYPSTDSFFIYRKFSMLIKKYDISMSSLVIDFTLLAIRN